MEATEYGAEAVQGIRIDVLGTVSTCMCACTTDNTLIVRCTCFKVY